MEQPHGGALLPGGIVGHPGTGGRPPEELRRLCREQVQQLSGVEFVAGVMAGTETEDVVVTVGSGKDARTEVSKVRPRIRDRLYAAELLLDRGYGKAPQKLEVEAPERQETGEQNIARLVALLPRVIAHLPIEERELLKWLKRGREREEVLVSGRTVRARKASGRPPKA